MKIVPEPGQDRRADSLNEIRDDDRLIDDLAAGVPAPADDPVAP